MRPWAATNMDDYLALATERGTCVPSIEDIRERIATRWGIVVGDVR
ncbi:hypothetical protein [Kutzneria sp. NPDC052558]